MQSHSSLNDIYLVKHFIVENESFDSDFWNSGGNDTLEKLLRKFNASDWETLKVEINSWTSMQQAILADALIYPEIQFENVDTGEMYGYIFTIVEDSEADYMIQQLDVLYSSNSLNDSLLTDISCRILKLMKYTQKIHNVHDYDRYLTIIKRLSNGLINKK